MSWIAFGSRLDIFASRWDPGCLHLRASYEGLGLEGQTNRCRRGMSKLNALPL